jgi:hypothetical protein
VGTASPFDTTRVPDGGHTVTAAIDLSAGGAEVVHATFTVANTAPDTTPPAISAVSPADGATAVAIGSSVTATFSEAMDATTVDTGSFTLTRQGATTPVAAAVTYDPATRTATLRPSTGLDPSSTYTATITTAMKDTAGNALATNKSWSFTTGATAPPPDPTAGGLRGEYYDNKDLTGLKLTRTDPTVDFNWGTGSPDRTVGADTFSVRWTGSVKGDHAQTYTFYTTSNDGVRLWVGGTLVVNNWTDHGTREDSGTIALQAGQWYPVRLEYYEGTGSATIKLSYSSASTPKQVVPSDHLSPTSP